MPVTTTIILGRGEERRVRGGHPWVFSNEIREVRGDRQPGAAAEFLSAGGDFIGIGYYNPHSLIAGRILTRTRDDIDTVDFFRHLLTAALAYRHARYPGLSTFRLVHGEGDLLPGLVVDKYGDFLSMQFLTQGMETRRELICTAIADLLKPQGIVARNDVAVRNLEGLRETVEVISGEIPEMVEVAENGLRFSVDLLGGQKTGHFLDQKENHLLLKPLAAGKDMLDCFCYAGSWGVHGAAFGARSVTCLDISAKATALAAHHAALNGVGDRVTVETADAFERLRSLKHEGRRFGVIVMDPPAFVKNKKQLREAEKGYLTVNRRAMELLDEGGCLITCSCSFHMQREQFREILGQAARQAGRSMRLLGVHTQAADHPVLLAVPETEYLKCVVLQAL